MARSQVIVVVLAFAIGAAGCGSKKHRLGRVEDVQLRAKELGCELEYNGAEAQCEVLVGRCNCRLNLLVGGDFAVAGKQLTGNLRTFGVGLWDCPRSQSLSPLWVILDPMFDNENDRKHLHDLLANPPHVKGAPSEAATHLVTNIGPYSAEITWAPKIWRAVKLPDPSLAESWITVGLFSSRSESRDELTTLAGDVADYPTFCHDNTRRPWAEPPPTH
jgi:hypothetical protein